MREGLDWRPTCPLTVRVKNIGENICMLCYYNILCIIPLRKKFDHLSVASVCFDPDPLVTRGMTGTNQRNKQREAWYITATHIRYDKFYNFYNLARGTWRARVASSRICCFTLEYNIPSISSLFNSPISEISYVFPGDTKQKDWNACCIPVWNVILLFSVFSSALSSTVRNSFGFRFGIQFRSNGPWRLGSDYNSLPGHWRSSCTVWDTLGVPIGVSTFTDTGTLGVSPDAKFFV